MQARACGFSRVHFHPIRFCRGALDFWHYIGAGEQRALHTRGGTQLGEFQERAVQKLVSSMLAELKGALMVKEALINLLGPLCPILTEWVSMQSKKAALCDIVPPGDGVLLAATHADDQLDAAQGDVVPLTAGGGALLTATTRRKLRVVVSDASSLGDDLELVPEAVTQERDSLRDPKSGYLRVEFRNDLTDLKHVAAPELFNRSELTQSLGRFTAASERPLIRTFVCSALGSLLLQIATGVAREAEARAQLENAIAQATIPVESFERQPTISALMDCWDAIVELDTALASAPNVAKLVLKQKWLQEAIIWESVLPLLLATVREAMPDNSPSGEGVPGGHAIPIGDAVPLDADAAPLGGDIVPLSSDIVPSSGNIVPSSGDDILRAKRARLVVADVSDKVAVLQCQPKAAPGVAAWLDSAVGLCLKTLDLVSDPVRNGTPSDYQTIATLSMTMTSNATAVQELCRCKPAAKLDLDAILSVMAVQQQCRISHMLYAKTEAYKDFEGKLAAGCCADADRLAILFFPAVLLGETAEAQLQRVKAVGGGGALLAKLSEPEQAGVEATLARMTGFLAMGSANTPGTHHAYALAMCDTVPRLTALSCIACVSDCAQHAAAFQLAWWRDGHTAWQPSNPAGAALLRLKKGVDTLLALEASSSFQDAVLTCNSVYELVAECPGLSHSSDDTQELNDDGDGVLDTGDGDGPIPAGEAATFDLLHPHTRTAETRCQIAHEFYSRCLAAMRQQAASTLEQAMASVRECYPQDYETWAVDMARSSHSNIISSIARASSALEIA